jgi:S1-C subfamily serine protease
MTEPDDAPRPIDPADDDTPTAVYSPEPANRPDWASPWAREADDAFARAEPETDAPASPAAAPEPAAAVAPVPPTHASRSVGLGTLVATVVLSATLASAGTFTVLSSTGALKDRGTGAGGPAASQGTGGAVPVTIDESSAIVDAAAKVSPAVVRIIVEGTTLDPFGQSVPDTGIGSGIIYDAAGWILTNRHVVTSGDGTLATSVTVEFKDGKQVSGKVYGVDTLTDLAIVKVDAGTVAVAPIGTSAEIKVGQLAIAIGSPLGTYSNSVTSGIVSATGRSVTVNTGTRLTNLIQTDAAINPGNSGGPLLDAAGNVIGVNTAMASGSTGIGFAIPIDIARPIMAQAVAGHPLARPYIGIRYQTIDVQLQAEQKLPVDHGALVGPSQSDTGASLPGVVPGGPADAAGIKEGDIIVGVEDVAVDREHPLDLVLSGFGPGQTVTLKIVRGTETIELKITLGTRPSDL